MQKLFKILFLSCLKATELVEKQMHFQLSVTERWQLKLHKSMCKACQVYEKQSIFIEKGISMQKPSEKAKYDTEDLKKSITQMLQSHQGK